MDSECAMGGGGGGDRESMRERGAGGKERRWQMEQLARCQGIHRSPASTRRLTDSMEQGWTGRLLLATVKSVTSPRCQMCIDTAKSLN